jgi:hypothetical protein
LTLRSKASAEKLWLQLLTDKLLAKQIEEGTIVLVAGIILLALM